MPFRIRILNFQSIAKADIEVNGFTVITGPNDIGKSAVLRAVAGLFRNYAGVKDSFRRKGEDRLRVELEFDDVSVAWERGKKVKTFYEIGPHKIEGVGKGPPPELDALGIKSIKPAGKVLWPQIADQFEGQVFLLNEVGSVVAEAVADVETVGRLNRCLKSAESDRRSTASELKFSRENLTRLEAEALRFEGLGDIEVEIQELEKEVLRAKKIRHLWITFAEFRQQMNKAKGIIDNLAVVDEIHLSDQDFIDEARDLLKKEEDLSVLARRHTRASEAASEYLGLDEALDGIFLEESFIDEARDLLKEEEDLSVLVRRHTRASEAASKYQGLDEALEGISLEEDLVEEARANLEQWQEIKDLSDKQTKLTEGIRKMGVLLDEKQRAFQAVSDEIQELLDSIGYCPTCGSESSDHHHEAEAAS